MSGMKHWRVIDALGALAHEYRLAIYRLLVERGPEGLAAGAIGTRIGLGPSTLTFHLEALQRAGLITPVRASRQLIYSADFGAMNDLVGYLTENCCTSSSKSCATDCQPVPSAKSGERRKAA